MPLSPPSLSPSVIATVLALLSASSGAFAQTTYELRAPARFSIPPAAAEPEPEPVQPSEPKLTTDFAALQLAAPGTTVVGTRTLTNEGPIPIFLGSPTSNLSLQSSTCFSELAPGESCVFTYTWTPALPGSTAAATFSIQWGGQALSETLTASTPISSKPPASWWYWSGLAAQASHGVLLTDGNRTIGFPSGLSANEGASTASVRSGQWYAELSSPQWGQAQLIYGLGGSSQSVFIRSDGANGVSNKWAFGKPGAPWTDTSYTSKPDDVIGVAVDVDRQNVKYYLYQDGACRLIADISSPIPAGTNQSIYTHRLGTAAATVSINAGQRPFKCLPPLYSPGFW